ncbi:hypothetical protein AAZX31_16G197500 [Glycine max]|uniref:Uncharacterized protein n=2 Tax=Glycine subgen. Soja TaxID=1462606 RepID=I1MQQ3_SOYBN|nr:uncharacterized protein LOC100527817 [Glycine max]XP_028208110.1 uncharacterized protein LOC114391252 [Glycine soja]KAG4939915.1 hypothetical protein JHK86_046056 [Glycine max]KAG4941951.1 hypothetical protein JHK87_045822 [Glycine soja]KAG4952730.1 hypothetical protein JHK85_046597 [Glycine max]KAG5109156.1 hypothetical protein JHK84_046063 [Glycine max]KAH1207238.1 hypothetical protein GmHk_16G047458 [Glycine max]|eukprot:XP_003547638.1 uncharacterized protein LOC100527817 [Glycine max]
MDLGLSILLQPLFGDSPVLPLPFPITCNGSIQSCFFFRILLFIPLVLNITQQLTTLLLLFSMRLHLLLLLLLLLCFSAPHASAQSSQARSLDAILQEYAFKALVKPRTGTIYNATATQLPSNLTGVKISALRLRSGSMRRKGFPSYNEFEIPIGVIAKPYVKRLVLVYQNLGNWSNSYYPLPNYTYLAPVLGLLVYNASNLSATNLPTLNVNASGDPIKVKFLHVKVPPLGAVPKCVWFDLQGSSNFSNVTGGNTCSTSSQGHFSIVAESSALPPPAPSQPPSPPPPPAAVVPKESKSSNKVGVIVGSVLGGFAFLVLLSLLVLWLLKYKQKKKIQQMERAADAGEALHMASVGDTKAPAATVTRTQPTLEHEYAP